MKKKIFIIGTGRSGTHWLGHIIESSSEIKVHIEKKPIFSLVTKAALVKSKRKVLLPLIILYYNFFPLFTNKHFCDKSHPNIWLVDYLNKYVSHSYFIGIIRNPYATVSSMLLHDGVLKWIKNWRYYPIPNDFLGITNDNFKEYAKMSIEAKCTMRWIAHKIRLISISEKYPTKSLILDYDELINEIDNKLRTIESFLNLKNKLPVPEIKFESKEKWKDNLTADQIKIISNTLQNNNFQNHFIT